MMVVVKALKIIIVLHLLCLIQNIEELDTNIMQS